MYRLVRFVIRRLFSAFKAYHKFPLTIASDAPTKTVSGRLHKRPTINRNVGDSVNSHGVSNFTTTGDEPDDKRERLSLCQGFGPDSTPSER